MTRNTLGADDVVAFVRRLSDEGEDVPREARLLLGEMRAKIRARGASPATVSALFPPNGSAAVEAFATCLKLTAAEVWAIVDDERRAAEKSTRPS